MAPEDWEAVIGMEVHAQLSTRSKMFCSCSTDYLGKPPNSTVCPVCLGMPGVLPVANRAAVEKVLRTALALGGEIPEHTKFDRKNYFYPDLPKGYQISQYDLPMSRGGALEVDGRTVRITRVHLEEDTGSLKHAGDQLHGAEVSLVDLNRSGMPLMEVVTEPDIVSADEARDYAQTLRQVLRYVGASEADMERGQLRAEANVSVRRRGSSKLGVKTELKNINSFRALQRAVQHEIERQVAVLEAGGRVVQETRGWSEARQETFSQRSKEYAEDYRYFPEPDLPPIRLDSEWIDSLRADLPELPAARRRRFVVDHGLSDYDAALMTEERATADYFEAVVASGAQAKAAANWIATIGAGRVPAAAMAAVLEMMSAGSINREQARAVLDDAAGTGRDPSAIVSQRGLAQVSDEDALLRVIDEVVAANPQPVADYRAGNQGAIGPILKALAARMSGSANMKVASELLRRRLSEPERAT